MAADVAAASVAGSETRTWLQEIIGTRSGIQMSNFDAQFRYYLAQASGRRLHPSDIRESLYPRSGTPWEPWGLTIRYNQSPRTIARELADAAQVRRIIVWDRVPLNDKASAVDEIPRELGAGWRATSEQTYVSRLHWTWSEMGKFRRREYARAAASTVPTTKP
jgi:hypothetical protein